MLVYRSKKSLYIQQLDSLCKKKIHVTSSISLRIGGLANTSCTRNMVCPDSPIGIHQLNTQTPTKMRKPQPKIHIIHQLNQTIKATKETNQTYQSYHESHKNQLTSHHRPPRLGVPGIAHHEAEALTKSGLRNTGSKVIGKSYPYCVVYRTCFIKSCIYRLMC